MTTTERAAEFLAKRPVHIICYCWRCEEAVANLLSEAITEALDEATSRNRNDLGE